MVETTNRASKRTVIEGYLTLIALTSILVLPTILFGHTGLNTLLIIIGYVLPSIVYGALALLNTDVGEFLCAILEFFIDFIKN